jgi:tetratricopeptide (TPR) repeat protein
MAYFNLGNVYQDLKQYSNAVECFQNVLRIDPSHGDALFNLAIAFHDKAMSAQTSEKARLVDLQQALSCYKNVCQLMPYLEEASRAAEQIAVLIEKYSSNTVVASVQSGSSSNTDKGVLKSTTSMVSASVDENSMSSGNAVALGRNNSSPDVL